MEEDNFGARGLWLWRFGFVKCGVKKQTEKFQASLRSIMSVPACVGDRFSPGRQGIADASVAPTTLQGESLLAALTPPTHPRTFVLASTCHLSASCIS